MTAPRDPIAATANDRRVRAVVTALIIAHVSLTAFLAATLNIWIDEAYSLDTTGAGVARSLHQALSFELQPPLYFVMLAVWRSLSHSIFLARVPSIVFVTLGLVFLLRAARRYLSETEIPWLAAALVTHPFLVWAAVEIRPYALILFWASVLAYLFRTTYESDNPSARVRIGFVLVAAAALYTHYYLGFILTAWVLALIVLGRWRAIPRYVLDMSVAGLICLPLAWIVRGQMSEHRVSAEGGAALVQAIRETWWRVQGFLLPLPLVDSSREALLPWRDRVLWVAMVGSAVAVLVRRRKPTRSAVAIVAAAATVAVQFVWLRTAVGKDLFELRHLVTLFAPTVLAVVAGVSVLRVRAAVPVLATFVIAFNLTTLWVTYLPLAKLGDYARVAAYLHEHEKAGQPVLVMHGDRVLALRHYYRGVNTLEPFPREVPLDPSYLEAYVVHDEEEVSRAFDRAESRDRGIWFYENTVNSYLGIATNRDVARRWIDQHCRVLDDHVFYAGARLRLLVLRDPLER